DPLTGGGLGQADGAADLGERHAAVVLEVLDDRPVNRIEPGVGRSGSLLHHRLDTVRASLSGPCPVLTRHASLSLPTRLPAGSRTRLPKGEDTSSRCPRRTASSGPTPSTRPRWKRPCPWRATPSGCSCRSPGSRTSCTSSTTN